MNQENFSVFIQQTFGLNFETAKKHGKLRPALPTAQVVEFKGGNTLKVDCLGAQ
jgi:hypothetical protein